MSLAFDPLQSLALRLQCLAKLANCTVFWGQPTILLPEVRGNGERPLHLLGYSGSGVPTVVFRLEGGGTVEDAEVLVAQSSPGGEIFSAIEQMLPLSLEWRIEVQFEEEVIVAPAELGRSQVGKALVQPVSLVGVAGRRGVSKDELLNVAMCVVAVSTKSSKSQQYAIRKELGRNLAEPLHSGELVSREALISIESRICAADREISANFLHSGRQS